MNGSKTRQVTLLPALAVALLAVALGLTASPPAEANPDLDAKRQRAREVLVQVRELDSDLSRAIESYNFATIELERIEGDLKANGRHLVVAQGSLRAAQSHIAARLNALYVNGGGGGAVEVIFGAKSLDDLLGRLDVIEHVGRQDARVLRDVQRFGLEVKQRRAKLREARKRQKEVVASRASTKHSIEGRLKERERMLASVRNEVAELEAEERRRQERITARARARLAELEADGADPGSLAAQGDLPPAKYGASVGVAMQYLGVPYVWGGMSPSGFDCSGLVAFAYAQLGVYLPHHAASQYGYGVPVGRDQLLPGDIVFFDGLGHNGLYIGGGQFVHAPHTGEVVKISSLSDEWYAAKWVGARRVA